MEKENFLIYGAYGYTGELISRLAVEKGHRPTLAGRDENKTKQLAAELQLPYVAFDLNDQAAVEAAIRPFKAVLHCAGPFALTARPKIKACLNTQTHYLDITGEIEVFEYAASKDKAAKAANIVVLPGVGFDVVPSDCLASFLKQALPSATHLELAFAGLGGLSQGTALTMARNAHRGGAIRKEGKIKVVPAAYEVREIDYGPKQYTSVTIPWGDVSTAYYRTQIPNIKVFTAQPKKAIRMLKLSNYFGWLIKTDFVQNYLKKKIKGGQRGPNEDTRKTFKSYLWGKASNNKKTVEARLITPEGYALTATTALMATERVLQGEYQVGFQTPSLAFGADFILEVEGTERTLV